MMTRICTQLALVAVLGLSGAAQAALQGRDLNGNPAAFEAYYDTVLDITWLDQSSSLGPWDAINIYVADFVVIGAGGQTYGNWRLPTIDELTYLNGDVGVIFGSNHMDPFVNVLSTSFWSSTEYDANNAWYFNFAYDYRLPATFAKTSDRYALMVSSGDIAAVPEAETWTMLLAGLTLVGVAVRRRRG